MVISMMGKPTAAEIAAAIAWSDDLCVETVFDQLPDGRWITISLDRYKRPISCDLQVEREQLKVKP